MSKVVITIDIDWACEAAIAETVDFFIDQGLPITVFSTHNSPVIADRFSKIDVGLHPFFGEGSSHGKSIPEVIDTITSIPHNILAFRCHRFASSNESINAMKSIGMKAISNVCTDCDILPPFKHRSGLYEFPIFLEDGGYLYQQHSLSLTENFKHNFYQDIPKILLIHPMHFVINTPNFSYMTSIKKSLSRREWQLMNKQQLKKLRYSGVGIRNFFEELFAAQLEVISLKQWYSQVLTQHTHHSSVPRQQNQTDQLQGSCKNHIEDTDFDLLEKNIDL